MSEYHKIQTVYMRDPDTKHRTLLDGQWSLPEFGYLASLPWEWTEKIDGTNIRVVSSGGSVTFGGRTDAAQIPAKLIERLQHRFLGNAALGSFGECVLYGEGYGAGIQKGGGDYRADQDFALFDVWCGGMWLRRSDVYDIAGKLDVPHVPVVGHGPLHEAISVVRDGLVSTLAATSRGAEGLVMRPAHELLTRRGERIIAKIKTKDFAK